MPKNLPIQFVETRGEQDVFLKEGGGGSELPKWVNKETMVKLCNGILFNNKKCIVNIFLFNI